MTTDLADHDLEDRLRRTLNAVAQTVGTTGWRTATTAGPAGDQPTVRRGPRRKTVVGAAGLGVTTVLLAAGAVISSNPDVVTQLPPEDVLQSGAVDGDTWYMVPARLRDLCGRRFPGVEVLLASRNVINVNEAHSGGMSYREHDMVHGCARPAGPADLLDPRVISIGFMNTEHDAEDGVWVGTIGVHPDVTSIVVTSPGDEPQRRRTVAVPSDPAGPRYTVFSVPYEDRSYSLALHGADGRLLARSTETTPDDGVP